MNENPLKKKSEIFTKFHDVELGFLRFYRVLPGFTGFFLGCTQFYPILLDLIGIWVGVTGIELTEPGFDKMIQV